MAFVVVLGFVMRLAVPLALTIVLALWLRRMDTQWQQEGARRQPPAAVAPCWEQRGCPPEQRGECAAFAQPDTPCWQVFRAAGGELKPACLTCAVFRDAPARS